MRGRWTRVAVPVLLVAVGAAAALALAALERRLAGLRADEDAIADRFDRVRATLVDIAAAQQGYVAPGQLDQPWFERTSTLVERLTADVEALPSLLRGSPAQPTRQALTTQLDAFADADQRARQNLDLGQELMAADVIYSDGRSVLDGLRSEIDRIAGAERAGYRSAAADLRLQQWGILGATALVWLGGVLALALSRRPTASQAPPKAVEKRPSVQAVPRDVRPHASGRGDPRRHPPARRDVDVAETASVCEALSTVDDAGRLSVLLGRAARVVDASGVVLWAAAGERLFAAASHGYPPDVAARFGSITVDADNAAAEAWRSSRAVEIPAGDSAAGALVVPIRDSNACIGVLSFELPMGTEPHPHCEPLARIVAAQLATVIAAPVGQAAGGRAASAARPA